VIILEFLAKLLVTFLFEGIILGFFRLIRKGYTKVGELVCGIIGTTSPEWVAQWPPEYANNELVFEIDMDQFKLD
jgi:hypothetical protein